jgi:hypothetical protein
LCGGFGGFRPGCQSGTSQDLGAGDAGGEASEGIGQMTAQRAAFGSAQFAARVFLKGCFNANILPLIELGASTVILESLSMSMRSQAELFRQRLEKIRAQLKPIIRRLYAIALVNRFREKFTTPVFAIGLCLAPVALLTGWSWLKQFDSLLKGTLFAVTTAAAVWGILTDQTWEAAPSRHLNDDFADQVIAMMRRASFRFVSADSDADIRQAAELEHEAFFGPSLTSLAERIERIGLWLRSAYGLGQFIYFDDKLIGYSVMIPVSDPQMMRFLKGYSTEWSFDVTLPAPDAPRLTLYAQSIFVKHKFHSGISTLGLAQAAALNHLLSLLQQFSSIMGTGRSNQAVWNLLQNTRIVADEGSSRGRRFMRHLGFVRHRKRTANKRNIWILDLSTPPRTLSQLQSRRLMARFLGIQDDHPAPRLTLRDHAARLSDAWLGYSK